MPVLEHQPEYIPAWRLIELYRSHKLSPVEVVSVLNEHFEAMDLAGNAARVGEARRRARALNRAIGWAIVLVAAAASVAVFVAVDSHSHSASDTFYGVFPFFVCTFLLIDWIGGRTSDRVT